MIQKLLVATRNAGKVEELADMLADLKIMWLSLDDVGTNLEVPETGTTFEENAILKATTYAAATGMLTLADDSGLEVDALDGRPGVLTARYGGHGLTPIQRYEKLLVELSGVPRGERAARFRCAVAVADVNGLIGTANGICEGAIALVPAGSRGFGYDPIFYLPDEGRTMAQLPAAEKHRISHRGRAVAKIAPLIQKHLDDC